MKLVVMVSWETLVDSENVTGKGNDGVGNLSSSSLLQSVDLEQDDITHSKKSFL